MGCNTAPQRPCMIEGEVFNGKADFGGKLDTGELLTGTPTVVEQTTSDLTISNVVVNTAAITVNGITVAIGEGVEFKVVGHLAATGSYTLLITATTNSTPAQTRKLYVEFDAEA